MLCFDGEYRENHRLFLFFKYFLGLFFFLIDRTAEDVTGNKLRERGVTRRKWPQVGTPTRDRYSEDKASVHGTPALTTELPRHPNHRLFQVRLQSTGHFKIEKKRSVICGTVPILDRTVPNSALV